VIACINGFALGGGCEIAMACTMRLASENAKLGQPEVKLGIIPGYGGTQRLPRLVGKGVAMQMVLAGEMITAQEAHRIGLVNEVTAAAELIPRAEAIAKELRKLGVTWSCNAKANVPRETLKVLRNGGLRLLLVGYESGNQKILHNIKKGMRTDVARKFTKDCRDLGITIHGTFIMGLPGETKETIEETIRFANEINPHTIQVSLAAPYPGTVLFDQAVKNGWLDTSNAELVNDDGVQIAPLHYPHLTQTEIFNSVEEFYRRFYFRSGKIASIVGEMVRDRQMMIRRLREGIEFFHFLRERRGVAH